MAPSSERTAPPRCLPESPSARYIAIGYTSDSHELLKRSDEVEYESSESGRIDGYRAPFYTTPIAAQLHARERTLADVEADLLAAFAREAQYSAREKTQRAQASAIVIPDDEDVAEQAPHTPRRKKTLSPPGAGPRKVQIDCQLHTPPASVGAVAQHPLPSAPLGKRKTDSVLPTATSPKKSRPTPNLSAPSLSTSEPMVRSQWQPDMRHILSSMGPESVPMQRLPMMAMQAEHNTLAAPLPGLQQPNAHGGPGMHHGIANQQLITPPILPQSNRPGMHGFVSYQPVNMMSNMPHSNRENNSGMYPFVHGQRVNMPSNLPQIKCQKGPSIYKSVRHQSANMPPTLHQNNSHNGPGMYQFVPQQTANMPPNLPQSKYRTGPAMYGCFPHQSASVQPTAPQDNRTYTTDMQRIFLNQQASMSPSFSQNNRHNGAGMQHFASHQPANMPPTLLSSNHQNETDQRLNTPVALPHSHRQSEPSMYNISPNQRVNMSPAMLQDHFQNEAEMQNGAAMRNIAPNQRVNMPPTVAQHNRQNEAGMQNGVAVRNINPSQRTNMPPAMAQDHRPNGPTIQYAFPGQQVNVPATLSLNNNRQPPRSSMHPAAKQHYMTQRDQLSAQHQAQINATLAQYGAPPPGMPNHPMQQLLDHQRAEMARLFALQRDEYTRWQQARNHAQQQPVQSFQTNDLIDYN